MKTKKSEYINLININKTIFAQHKDGNSIEKPTINGIENNKNISNYSMRNNIRHLKYVGSDKTKNAHILEINDSNTPINTIITNAFQAPIKTENISNHLNSEYKITNLDTTKNITDLNSTNNENEIKNTKHEGKKENESETKIETESDNIVKIKGKYKYKYKNENENKNCMKTLNKKMLKQMKNRK